MIADSPTTCRAAVFLAPGQALSLRDFPVPVPDAGEAVVRVECCTVCGSDLHTVTGARTEPMPSILGHEILGVVDRVGDPAPVTVDGDTLRPGDRVTWSVAVACGTCDRCHRGMPQKCRALFKYGHSLAVGPHALSGGMAEAVLLRRGSAVVRVETQLPAEVMCPASCATATVAAALRAAGTVAGQRVLVFGAGMLGLTAAAMARSLGASTVAVCDISPRRLAVAPTFGADAAIEFCDDPAVFDQRLASTWGSDRCDVAIEVSGAPAAVEAAVGAVDVGGQAVLVGSVINTRPVQLDPQALVRRCASVHGVHNYAPDDLRAAVTFLAREGGAYPFGSLVEARCDLADVPAAIARAVVDRPIRLAVYSGSVPAVSAARP